MTGSLTSLLIAGATVVLMGLWCVSVPVCRASWSRLITSAFVFGLVTSTSWMLLLALLGIRWSVALILAPPGIVSLVVLVMVLRRGHRLPSRPAGSLALVPLLVPLGLLCFAAVQALATSFDLIFFWGVKGQRFVVDRGIDPNFLANPDHWTMHPDYPPLVPAFTAWAGILSGSFDWFVPVLATPLFGTLGVLAFWAFLRPFVDDAYLAGCTLLYACIFSTLFVHTYSAGNAESVLLFFVTVAGAAAFARWPTPKENDAIIACALAGAALTKVEGVAVVAALVAAIAVGRARSVVDFGKHVFRLAIVPVVLLGQWILFVRMHGFLDAYGGGTYGSFRIESFSLVARALLQQASFEFSYLPWIAVAALYVLGAARRYEPIIVAVILMAFLVYVFMHGEENPTAWIIWAGQRVLLTPLSILLVGGAVAMRKAES